MSGLLLGLAFDVDANASNPLALVASAPAWASIASAWVGHMDSFMTFGPLGLVCISAGGPLTGSGTISGLSGTALGDAMATAAGTISDPVSKAAWRAMGADLVTQIQGAGVAVPGTLAATSGGGPIVVGVGAIT